MNFLQKIRIKTKIMLLKSYLILVSLYISLQLNTSYMANELKVEIFSENAQYKSGDALSISFVVTNLSDVDSIKFCKFSTPCEGFYGDFFIIKHIESGQVLKYKGSMVKRTPPSESDFILISPLKKHSCSINLTKAYLFNLKGRYTIQFIGKTVNNLADSNQIVVELL